MMQGYFQKSSRDETGDVEALQNEVQKQQSNRWDFKIILFLMVSALLATLLFVSQVDVPNTVGILLKGVGRVESSSDVQITLTATNPDYPTLASLDYLPWQYLIEPYKAQTIEISEYLVDGVDLTDDVSADGTDYSITWTIDGM